MLRSSTLFKIYVRAALENWKNECANMEVQVVNETLVTFNFAEDQVTLAEL